MNTKTVFGAALVLTLAASSSMPALAQDEKASSFLEARRGFTTKLVRTERESEALPPPPESIFSLVHYQTAIGEMGAYLGTAPDGGDEKYPAIVWITGGLPAGGIGESEWQEEDCDNDQSAKAYRLEGVVMMYPTMRGSYGNPGAQETFFGEVDDVLAAVEYLRGVPYVDADRIYLGGHSTGATLALLVAAAAKTKTFRAVFAFGPIDDPANYGADNLTYDPDDERESRLRAPIHWLSSIACPTFVIEGERGNAEALHAITRAKAKSRYVQCISVKGAGHFDLLAPVNQLFAEKVAALEGGAAFELAERDVQATYDGHAVAMREASDLSTLSNLRHTGMDLGAPQVTLHYLYGDDREELAAAAKAATAAGFEAGAIEQEGSDDDDPYFALTVTKRLTPRNLDAVFAASASMAKIAADFDLEYDGWDIEID